MQFLDKLEVVVSFLTLVSDGLHVGIRGDILPVCEVPNSSALSLLVSFPHE